jgi:vacuolar-type H+-ATPase subunit H
LRSRRSTEHERSAREIQQAHDEATKLVADAHAESDRRVREATEEVERLRAHRDRVHDDLGTMHRQLADLIADAASTRQITDGG